MAKIRLSPTGSLSIFLNCPRCFWLQMNKKVKRPRGIFPSLPSGMDRVIKKYFDGFRLKNELPPEIQGKVEGRLFSDLNLLEKWRSWRATNLRYEDNSLNVSLSGALDDCLVSDGYFIPLDYKTKGAEIKGDPAKYYQTQLDCYCLILEASGYKTKGLAYLVYYYPKEVSTGGRVIFEVSPFKINTNPDNAKKLVEDAAKLLEGPLPKSSWNCEYCCWLEARRKTQQGAQAIKEPKKKQTKKRQEKSLF